MAATPIAPSDVTPLNADANLEAGVLGACLTYPDRAIPAALAAGLHGTHFTASARRQAWEAITARHANSQTVDAPLIWRDLAPAVANQTLHLDASTLTTWMHDSPAPHAIGDYALELIELHRRRTVARHYTDAAHATQTGDTPAAERALALAAAVSNDNNTHAKVPEHGGAFILNQPPGVPAVWGHDDQVLWAQGEPLLIVGPPGVGKTTLIGQVVWARIGITDQVLGYPVTPSSSKLLYLASDRPKQIGRAFQRLATEADRETLDERLLIWPGPPPADLARSPLTLLQMAHQAGADTIILDSLKDMAIGLSDDETGAGLNQALQHCIADGIEICALHHQRKGQAGSKPKTLEDVYGSTWITAGAGSVILLWGQAGDLIVELEHIKQPAAQVGPLTIEHDHDAGTSTIHAGFDMHRFLSHQPAGTTSSDAARQWFLHDPSTNEVQKARRWLERLVKSGNAARADPPARGGDGGGADGAKYYPVVHVANEPAYRADVD